MNALEISFLNAFFILDWFNQTVNEKYLESQQSEEDFTNSHISYLSLYQVYYHCAIIQGRKLYEGKVRYALTNDEWLQLREFRHKVAHANYLEDRSIVKVADTNKEVDRLLNKIVNAIDTRYNLSTDQDFQKYAQRFYDDLGTLGGKEARLNII